MFVALLMAVSLALTPPVSPPITVPTAGLPRLVHPPKNVRAWTPPPSANSKEPR
jgi:hypothetical protein